MKMLNIVVLWVFCILYVSYIYNHLFQAYFKK